MGLRGVGRFKELRHGDPAGPSIGERVRYADETKTRLLSYLAAAPVLAASGSVVVDHFDGAYIGPLHLHTDGHWTWYSDLAHYLEARDVLLDADFVAHVLAASIESLQSVDLDEAQRRFFE